MSKLTKPQIQAHEKAIWLAKRGNLTDDAKRFVFDSYREDAVHINSKYGAHFTPFDLADALTLHIPYKYEHKIRIIDLCAGIGVLSYAAMLEGNDTSQCYSDITCLEVNPDYVEIGKKLLPDAKWICGDALDPDILGSLGRFDFAISNPPHGFVKSKHREAYSSGEFEYMVIEAASQIASGGAFIIPQMSAPFVYSGTNDHYYPSDCKAMKFEEKTGIELKFNVGVDTAEYINDWHCVTPICEIVLCDFTKMKQQVYFQTKITA